MRGKLFGIALTLAASPLLTGEGVISGSQQVAQADTYGAIAWGPTSHRWGEGHNYTSEADAEARALSECANSDCRIATWFRNACGALATASNGAWGANWGNDVVSANDRAMARCSQEGGAYCSITKTQCSEQ